MYSISDLDKLFLAMQSNKEIDLTFLSKNVDETKKLAYTISKKLNKQDIIVLNGELGSGKTSFIQGVAKYFDIEDQICSPTFTIVNEYTAKNNLHIFHFDVYRLENEDEFLDQIGTDYFENGICFIEWGNIIQNILPKNTIFIDISKDEEDINKRYFHIWRN